MWEFKQMPETLPLMAWTVEIITFKYVKLLLFVQQFFIDFLRIFDIAFFYCVNIFEVIDVKSPDIFFKYQNNSIKKILILHFEWIYWSQLKTRV